jgi:hypothetical protein
MIDDEFRAVGGMKIGENQPLCPPQIPHDLMWD